MNNLKGAVRKKVSGLNGPFLLAVSGGSDSMALVSVMLDIRKPIVVAHFDHGLRSESRAEAKFVEKYCNDNNVKFVTETAGPITGNIELAARKLRYEFLVKAAKANNCPIIMTAHHADDQAETVFQNIVRGTGINGLRGIAESRPIDGLTLFRPFLEIRKNTLANYLILKDIKWVEDPSNVDGNNRAMIRNKIFPMIRELMKQDPTKTLIRLSKLAKEANENC